MKLITHNTHKFATGMFWQIPDEGKRSINLTKLVKDTKHTMMCQIKTINPTWGFCHKTELEGHNKVASLGKFIIEVSGLSANYANSIICFKFKNSGEPTEDSTTLPTDLYGYIVLLNGTICPDEGEYVSTLTLTRESIISQARKYEIETLYLPLDVASTFCTIFEILTDAINNDELLTKLIHNLTNSQQQDLHNLINNELQLHSEYQQLLIYAPIPDLALLKNLMNEPVVLNKLQSHPQQQTLKYLIPSIITLPLTSSEIYWNNPKFKKNYRNALIHPISQKTQQKYKLSVLFLLLAVFAYLIDKTFINKEEEILTPLPTPVIPIPIAVLPQQLINTCLSANDRFFKDLGIWTLTKIACNSLGATLTFETDTDATLTQLRTLINKNNNDNHNDNSNHNNNSDSNHNTNIKLTQRVGTYSIKYHLIRSPLQQHRNQTQEQILDALQQSAINNSFQLNIEPANPGVSTKFTIIAQQSPVYLLHNSILDNTLLREINASFDQASGFYTWTLQGETQ